MARPRLSLYRLDQEALRSLETELRALLSNDDRAGVAQLLGLGEQLATRLASRPAVEWFVRTDDDPEAAPLHASLRRIAKRRALEKVWTSDHPSLEGRLRAYDVLREHEGVAEAIDRALDPSRMPFFLVRKGATTGLVREAERAALVEAIGPDGALLGVGDEELPAELVAFGAALAEHPAPLLMHDTLDV